MSYLKGILNVVLFIILLMGISCDSDLKCYVCTDCEFNYEGTETICENIRLPESDKVTASTQDTSVTDDGNTVTYETTEQTQTTDLSTTEETTYTEEPEKTTTVSMVITDRNTISTSYGDSTTLGESSNLESTIKPLPSEIEKPSINDQLITKPVSTQSYATTDYNLNTASSETITDLYTSEVSVTTSSFTSTTDALDTTTVSSTTKASSQTEGPGSTTSASSITASPETQDINPTISTSNLDTSTISNEESNILTEEGSNKGDLESKSTTQFPGNIEILSTEGYSKTDITTNTASSKTTTDSSVDREYETTVLLSSTIEAFSTTTQAPSSQTEGSPTLPSSTDASTTEEFGTTESTTYTILESTEGQNLLDNEPNVVMVDETKMYGPRQRLIRAIQIKQDAERKPRCIVSAYKEQNKTIIVRGCSFARKEEENCSSQEKGLKNNRCFVCDTDLCNSASTTVASVFVFIVTIFSVSNL